MRAILLTPIFLIVACASATAPEQAAQQRAAALIADAGVGSGAVLAPLLGLDGQGQPGLCGAIDGPRGMVRVVVDFGAGAVRSAPVGARRTDLGEARFCSSLAMARWKRQAAVDPTGLAAAVAG